MRWTRSQINVVLAAYLGWTLDAFDFFLMVFMFKDIAATFQVDVKTSATAVFMTLAARPLGAFLFGRMADRFGRKPTLMTNVLSFSVFEVLSGFAPTIGTFLSLRFLFGIAMGGEWGVGSALAFETIPARARGVVSGLLQSGYPSGFLLASVAVYFLYDRLGWRAMFVLGLLPAALVFLIRAGVDESPAWRAQQRSTGPNGLLQVLAREWRLAAYAVLLMTAFNFFSHGSQDAYPNLFLKVQHGFDTRTASRLTIIANVGAILGGICFGWLSERIGRRGAIILAVSLTLPVIRWWAFGGSVMTLGIGAFLMQAAVQGAWGIIPAHLNELSPPAIRATFPGLVYQLGNLIASYNLPIQVMIAERAGNDYGRAMAWVVGIVAVTIALLVLRGPERRGIAMS